MAGASEPDPVSTKQQRIAELAKQNPQMGFFSLAHHIDLRWLYEAFLRVRTDGATGVDGQTAQDYAAQLRDNLLSLLERAKSGTYRREEKGVGSLFRSLSSKKALDLFFRSPGDDHAARSGELGNAVILLFPGADLRKEKGVGTFFRSLD
jgi:hypothetical protein